MCGANSGASRIVHTQNGFCVGDKWRMKGRRAELLGHTIESARQPSSTNAFRNTKLAYQDHDKLQHKNPVLDP